MNDICHVLQRFFLGWAVPALLWMGLGQDSRADEFPFGVRIVDEETGRGVPLVELTTVHDIRYVTDSAGFVAIRDPELVGRKVFFQIRSHGYEFPKDGFGIRGQALDVTPGQIQTLKLHRVNLAERLYRVTGAGLYSDSLLLGQPSPVREPLLNAQVSGSDSVVVALYGGRIHWFWGDTNRLRYPLGNFHVTGATSLLPSQGGLDPDVGIDLTYFAGEDGFARPMAPMPGEGPTWIWGAVVLKDESGKERLFAGYEKVRGQMEVYDRGICEFDDARQQFSKVCTVAPKAPLHLQGHPFAHIDAGTDYVYFGDPYPFIRVRATVEALLDVDQYEGFTCLTAGSSATEGAVERSPEGTVQWGWKPRTPMITAELQRALIARNRLKREEGWIQLTDVESDKSVTAHRGSVAWNPYRKRWVLITTEVGGRSQLGEVWYAEAERPEGPWKQARRIVTHDRYSFYNPRQHPLFAKSDGRIIYFEGTYTRSFSGNPEATPRYEYNQVMYRLDLSHPKLAPAQER